MTKNTLDNVRLGIYVLSYKRSHEIMTKNVVPDCTYVVRASEEDDYRKAGIEKLLVITDETVDSLPKTRQWVLENTPEEIIIQLDDDIKKFVYPAKNNVMNMNVDDVEREFLRIAQMLYDLDLGFAALPMKPIPYNVQSEFSFISLMGSVYWFNKKRLKAKFDFNCKMKHDVDFLLQEAMHNRIALIPKYMGFYGYTDTNFGGNSVEKTKQQVQDTIDYLKAKWGQHFQHNFKRNYSRPNVKR